MDVVIPFKQDSIWDDNELRYSLRSLQTYFLDLDKVYLIGDRPSWITRVFHIPFKDDYPNNKGANIISKLIEACKDENISKDFLFLSDDQYFLIPTRVRDIQTYYTANLKGQSLTKGNPFWMECLRNVRDAMERDKLPCYNYEPHTPVIINKRKYWSTMMNHDWTVKLYPTLSLYFNTVLQSHEKMPENYRARFNEDGISTDIISGKQFLYHNDLGLSAELQKKIQELFPKKSRFEK